MGALAPTPIARGLHLHSSEAVPPPSKHSTSRRAPGATVQMDPAERQEYWSALKSMAPPSCDIRQAENDERLGERTDITLKSGSWKLEHLGALRSRFMVNTAQNVSS